MELNNTKIEGIIISKTLYREKDIIAHLLLRTGKQISVIFYGAKGGGKKQRPSLLEIGYLVNIELYVNSKNKDIFQAKEFIIKWSHNNIRFSYDAFYLMCFFVEVIQKMAVQENMKELIYDEEHQQIFNILSNAIFYLEESLKNNEYDRYQHAVMFFAKLLYYLGIALPESGKILELKYSQYNILQKGDIKTFEILFKHFCSSFDIMPQNFKALL